MKRRYVNLGLNGKLHRRPELIPFDKLYTSRCPRCLSLATIYIPGIAEGHCDECGHSWRFAADPETAEAFRFNRSGIRRSPTYDDLLGFCMVMVRRHVGYEEARKRYRSLGIPDVNEATWERAWKEARNRA